jgi:hypothetical protein
MDALCSIRRLLHRQVHPNCLSTTGGLRSVPVELVQGSSLQAVAGNTRSSSSTVRTLCVFKVGGLVDPNESDEPVWVS